MEKKVKNAWAFYDWANSVYSLVISTAIFPIYFSSVTAEYVDFFGHHMSSGALYSYSISAAFIIVAIISPFLSGIADYTGSKRKFLEFFCYMGSLACMGLYFFDGENLLFGLSMSIIASIGFWGSLVFYNAFLPEVAPPEEHDNLSAKGFSLGYIGASLLLILILIMTEMHGTFGFPDKGGPTRIGFILVGLWWMGFAQYTLRKLPNNPYQRKSDERYIWKGFQEVKKVWYELKEQKSLRRFLYSFFFYSMGVQTVIMLAALYGNFLGIETTNLIITILIIQFVAIAGAHMFAFISSKFGNLQSIKVSLIIWALVCGLAYTLSKEDPNINLKFYAVGGIVGLVMGGVQSMSRSTFSKLLKEDTQNHASYFSFYDVSEKIAVVIGTLTFGLLLEIYDNNMKASALSLVVFFVIGYLLILRIKRTKYVR
tara:strand:- start:905 stop:2185 length:1281 start_codon:yes stop_codon:yes gene_type:complete